MSRSAIQLLRILSLSIAFASLVACGGGGSDLVTLPEEELPKEPVSVALNSKAVKGPLANAKLEFYKVDLDEGLAGQHSRASKLFFRLLEESGAQYRDGSLQIISGSNASVLESLKRAVSVRSYPTNIAKLQQVVELSNDLESAQNAIADYIRTETNGYVRSQLSLILDGNGGLSDLQRKVKTIQTLKSEVDALRLREGNDVGFDELESAFRIFSGDEEDALRNAGWDQLFQSLDLNASNKTTLSDYESQLEELLSVGDSAGWFVSDSIARRNLTDLISNVSNAESTFDAELLIEKAIHYEGSPDLKAALSQFYDQRFSVSQVIENVRDDESLTSFPVLTSIIDASTSLDSLIVDVNVLFADTIVDAFLSALVSDEIDFSSGEPSNLVASRVSDSRSAITEVSFGDYDGLIYIKALSQADTNDINTGTKPFVETFSTLVHTDSITGAGDNLTEDRRIYYFKDDIELRDSEGRLVTEITGDDLSAELVRAYDEAIPILPGRYPTPLAQLGLNLILSQLKATETWQAVNIEGQYFYGLDDQLVKLIQENVSDILKSTFANTNEFDANIFDATPVITEESVLRPELQTDAITSKAVLEGFSSFLYTLQSELLMPIEEVFNLITLDLEDKELDGKNFATKLDAYGENLDPAFIVSRSPSEIFIPQTSFTVSESAELAYQEVFKLFESVNAEDIEVLQKNISYRPPSGGVDSDGDGVMDNSDQAPNDPGVSRVISPGYNGIWDVNVADGDNNFVLPFTGDMDIVFDVIEREGLCFSAPCISVGDLDTFISIDWTLIDQPAQGEMLFRPINTNAQIGVAVQAFVPGFYTLKGVFSSNAIPEQTYSVLITFEFINPETLEYVLDPASPIPGQASTVSIKATQAICEAYQSQNLCSDFTQGSEPDEFINIEMFGDAFSLNWSTVSFDDENQINISSQKDGITNDAWPTQFGDEVRLDLLFSSGLAPVSVYETVAIVSGDGDVDGDGISNKNDAFSADGNCMNVSQGIATVSDELTVCFQSLIDPNNTNPEPDLKITELANESWYYLEGLNLIARRDDDTGLFLPAIELDDNKPLKATFMTEDPVNRGVYLVYADNEMGQNDGEIDFVDFASGLVNDFVDAKVDYQVSGKPRLFDKFLLVPYENRNSPSDQIYGLYNPNGKEPRLNATRNYPRPGERLTFTLDDVPLSQISSLFPEIELSVKRVEEGASVNVYSETSNSENLIIPFGITALGDMIEFKLFYNFDLSASLNQKVYEDRVFILGINQFVLDDNQKSVGESISVLDSGGANLQELNDFIEVTWSRLNSQRDEARTLSKNVNSPYIYTPSIDSLDAFEDKYGDVIIAEVSYKHLNQSFPLKEFQTLLVGDTDSVSFDFDLNVSANTVSIVLRSDLGDMNYLERYYSPVWFVDDVRVSELDGLYTIDYQVPYGAVLSVSFEFSVGEQVGETDPVILVPGLAIESDAEFSLVPSVPVPGDELEVDPKDISDLLFSDILGYWYVNGDLTLNDSSFKFDTSSLNEGDVVTLAISLPDTDPSDDEIPELFENTASVVLGINRGEASDDLNGNDGNIVNDNDKDNDQVEDRLDYFRYDPACSLVSDGVPDDTDNDGVSDLDELNSSGAISAYPRNEDSDFDGLSDYAELIATPQTDPLKSDSDGDGFSDYYEWLIGSDGTDNADPGLVIDGVDYDTIEDDDILSLDEIAANDIDLDGIPNSLESVESTLVNNADTDGDGLTDGYELKVTGTDPANKDSDNDRLSDGLEVLLIGSDPLTVDTDGDGIPDGIEVYGNLNPTDIDSNKDGIPDAIPDLTASTPLTYEPTTGLLELYDPLTGLPKLWNATTNLPVPVEADQTGFPVLYDPDNNTVLQFYNPNDGSMIPYNPGTGLPVLNMVNGLPQLTDNTPVLFLGDFTEFQYNYKPMLAPGTCYGTWIAENPPSLIEITTIDQELDTEQQVAFADPSWGEILRYDAVTETYLTPVPGNLLLGKVSALEYGKDANSELYVGFQDGLVREYRNLDGSTPDAGVTFARAFRTGENNPISALVDQGAFLIIETYLGDQQYKQFLFDKSGDEDKDENDILHEINSSISIKTSVWDDSTNVKLWTLDTSAQAVFSAFTYDEANPELSEQSEPDLNLEAQRDLSAPLVLDDRLNDRAIRFASGDVYYLSGAAASSFAVTNDPEFTSAVIAEHMADGSNLSHFVTHREGERQVRFELIPDVSNATDMWNVTQTIPSRDVVSIFETQEDVTVSYQNVIDGNTFWKMARVHIGDSDEDGLPEWYESSVGIQDNDASDAATYLAGFLAFDDVYELVTDTDGDGLSDAEERLLAGGDIGLENLFILRPDFDFDGLTDFQEVRVATEYDVSVSDTANNGVFDGYEDADGDGLTNTQELNEFGTDYDNEDTDGDGLTDYQEIYITLTDPLMAMTDGVQNDGDIDADGDGLTSVQELLNGTNPLNADTDSDGLSDQIEVETSGSLSPLERDSDGDGISDFYEYDSGFTDIDATADGDGDGLNNLEEIKYGSDIANPDTDDDGLSDGQEVHGVKAYRIDETTISLQSDHDDDSATADQVFNFDSAPNPSVPGNGVLLFTAYSSPVNPDSDGDGELSDKAELTQNSFNYISNPTLLDSDEDGLADIIELNLADDGRVFNSDPLSTNSDSDGLDDLQEYEYEYEYNADPIEDLGFLIPPSIRIDPRNTDTDSDGIPDDEEISLNSNPAEPDTDNDKLDDAEELFTYGSFPDVFDSDDDGLSDWQDVYLSLSPLDNDSNDNGILDGDEDTDSDGLTNAQEFFQIFSDPTTQDTSAVFNRAGKLEVNLGSEAFIVINDLSKIVSDGSIDSAGNILASDGSVAYPNGFEFILSDNGISDASEDNDGDSIVNLKEIQFGTDPWSRDSDNDGVDDDIEISDPISSNPLSNDTDGDGLLDGDERLFGTNPRVSDTDNDGLTDNEEVLRGDLDPLRPDSDLDFIADGDDLAPADPDSDGDGILDGVEELILGLESIDLDFDQDNIPDNQEVWVFGYKASDVRDWENAVAEWEAESESERGPEPLLPDLALVGDTNDDGSPDLPFNTKASNPDWKPAPLTSFFKDAQPYRDFIEQYIGPGDQQILDQEIAEINADQNLSADEKESAIKQASEDAGYRIYIWYIADPATEDSDADGINDDLELLVIEPFIDSKDGSTNDKIDLDYAIDLTQSQSEIDTLKTESRFLASNALNAASGDDEDPKSKIPDGSRDADDDYLINSKETADSIIIADFDSANDPVNADGIPDGIELEVIGTDFKEVDTDGDSLNDGAEILSSYVAPSLATEDKTTNPYIIDDDQSCVPGEVRVDNVAGVNYCFSVEYKSFPLIVDSDNDRVDDSLDDFPLDSACSNAAEGFEPNGRPRCFASWMAEQDDATQIKYIDNADNSQIALTGPNWGYIIRYNLATTTPDKPQTAPSFTNEINGVSGSDDGFEFLAYLDNNRLYAVSASGEFMYIGVADTSEVLLSTLDIGSGQVENVIGAGSSLIVQVGQGLTAELRSYDAGGALQGSIGIPYVTLDNAFYDSQGSRLYFYLNDSDANYNVAYQNISGSAFDGSTVLATVFSNSDVLAGQLAVLRYDIPDELENANATPTFTEIKRLFIPSGMSTDLDLSDKKSLDQVIGLDTNNKAPYEQVLAVATKIDLAPSVPFDPEPEDQDDPPNGVVDEYEVDQTQSRWLSETHLIGSRRDNSSIVGSPDFSNKTPNSLQVITTAARDAGVLETGRAIRDYQFNAESNDERIFKVIPFTRGRTSADLRNEAFVVKRNNSMVSILNLGLRDYDTLGDGNGIGGDGMSCIYERAFNLVEETNTDCASASLSEQKDIFDDPDGDTLVNIEEYTFLTDPRQADSDGDSWDDAYEVNRGTNPLDPLDF